MKIAIFGGGGGIGRAVTPELVRRGHSIRLVGRSRSKLEPLAGDAVEIVTADLSDAAAARRAADGVDAILYAVGVPYDQFDTHPPLTRNAITAARAAGVGRFLLISNVYPYGRPTAARVSEEHPRNPPTRKGAIATSRPSSFSPHTTRRAWRPRCWSCPIFMAPAQTLSYAKEVFDGAVRGRVANIVGPLDVPREYVYLPDVGPVVADLFALPAAFGRTYNLGGPGTITTRAFIAAAERAAGTRIRTLPVNRTGLRLLGAFSPLMREIVEMYYLFTDPVVLDDTALRSRLPQVRKTPYADGIAATIASLREAGPVPAHV